MGGAPWVVRVYQTKVTVGVGDTVYGETNDQEVVQEANHLMDTDDANKLDVAIYYGKKPFDKLNETVRGGPALDSLTVVRAEEKKCIKIKSTNKKTNKKQPKMPKGKPKNSRTKRKSRT